MQSTEPADAAPVPAAQAAAAISPAPSAARRWLISGLKVLIAGGLLTYVLAGGKIDFGRLRRFLTSPYLALGIAMFSAQLWLGAQRLRVLLAPQGIKRGYFDMLRLTYLGAFFDVFLVTSVGGDAIKAFYLARGIKDGRRTEAISVLLLDRLMGLLGLLSLTLLIAVWDWGELWSSLTFRPYFLGLICVVFCLLGGMALIFSRRIHQWAPMQALLHRLPLGAFIDRAYAALHQYNRRLGVLGYAWLLSLLVHVLGVLGGYVLLRGIGGGDPPLGQFFVTWLIANFACSFFPLGAIGSGQIAYNEIFLQLLHLDVGYVLATALQLTFVLAKAPGLIAWILAREDRNAA